MNFPCSALNGILIEIGNHVIKCILIQRQKLMVSAFIAMGEQTLSNQEVIMYPTHSPGTAPTV